MTPSSASTGKPRRRKRRTKKATIDSSAFGAQTHFVTAHFSGVRKHTSIKMDSFLWEDFKIACKNNGYSTCDVLEKLALGFLVGVSQVCHKPTSLVVQVDAPRIVKRVRRRAVYFEDEVEVSEEAVSPRDVQEEISCHFCKHPAVGLAESSQGSRVFVCDVHKRELRQHSKWKVLR